MKLLRLIVLAGSTASGAAQARGAQPQGGGRAGDPGGAPKGV